MNLLFNSCNNFTSWVLLLSSWAIRRQTGIREHKKEPLSTCSSWTTSRAWFKMGTQCTFVCCMNGVWLVGLLAQQLQGAPLTLYSTSGQYEWVSLSWQHWWQGFIRNLALLPPFSEAPSSPGEVVKPRAKPRQRTCLKCKISLLFPSFAHIPS